jgi:hypothetical protein
VCCVLLACWLLHFAGSYHVHRAVCSSEFVCWLIQGVKEMVVDVGAAAGW